MPSLMSLFHSLMVIQLLFIRLSVSETFNCSSTRSSYIYCLDSDLPSTWYNNNSVIMTGWQMRVFLLYKADNEPTFYCGFYCSDPCDSYTFSIVSVGKSHSVVWSANQTSSVKQNAMVQLTKDALTVNDSDGMQVWSTPVGLSTGSIVGMKLNKTGCLNLFDNENRTIWQSPENKSAIVVPSPPPVMAPDEPNMASGPSLGPSPSPPTGGGLNGGLVAIMVVSGVAGLVCAIILLVYLRRWIYKAKKHMEEDCMKLVPGLPIKAEEGKLIDICVDEDVQNYGKEVERLIRVGAWCLQDDPTKRPLMSTVVKVLEGFMEVDPDIKFRFRHASAMVSPGPGVSTDDVSSAPPTASILSNPR
ncbi:hypothetical protein ACFE04_017347 [Oxalis oulophora]